MLTNSTKTIRPRYPVVAPFNSFYQKEFKSIIRRLTDCQHECKNYVETSGSVLGSYFSNSERHFSNCYDSLFISQVSTIVDAKVKNVVNLYDQNCRVYRTLPKGIQVANTWWSNSEPNILYFLNGKNMITSIDVCTGKIYPVVTFESFISLGIAGGEGDVSFNNEIVLDRDGKSMFIYDIDRKKISSLFSQFNCGSMGAKGNNVGVDYATISLLGDYILVSWSAGMPGHAGIEVYDREWNLLRQIYPGVIHWLCGVDGNGSEVIYTVLPFGFPDYIPSGMKPGDLVKTYIKTGGIVKLLDVPTWSHFMLCAPRGRYCDKIYMAYEERVLPKSIKTLWTQPDWAPFFGEMLEVNTDGSGFRRLCHVYPKPSEGVKKSAKYWQPDCNVFGNKILWRSCVADKNAIGDIWYVEQN